MRSDSTAIMLHYYLQHGIPSSKTSICFSKGEVLTLRSKATKSLPNLVDPALSLKFSIQQICTCSFIPKHMNFISSQREKFLELYWVVWAFRTTSRIGNLVKIFLYWSCPLELFFKWLIRLHRISSSIYGSTASSVEIMFSEMVEHGNSWH